MSGLSEQQQLDDVSKCSSPSTFDESIIRDAQMAIRRVVPTCKFIRALKETQDSFQHRMQKIVDLITEDANRPDNTWLIDMSLVVNGTSVGLQL